MNNHVSEWLSAYLDGELNSYQRSLVDAHLKECSVCEAELKSLVELSESLQKVTAPEFTLPRQFAARVNLHLPRQQAPTQEKRILQAGGWMVPVGLLAVWIFMSTSFLISDILSLAQGWGLFASASDWLVLGLPGNGSWSATLRDLGMLSGNTFNWASYTESLTRASLLQITLQVSVALLYLSWLAVWWTRHRRRTQDPLLEG